VKNLELFPAYCVFCYFQESNLEKGFREQCDHGIGSL
jgi:hypothetical protein